VKQGRDNHKPASLDGFVILDRNSGVSSPPLILTGIILHLLFWFLAGMIFSGLNNI
jgi:hypothetical protein